MLSSSPTYSFTIPSIHDETLLDCRIYNPSEKSGLDGNDLGDAGESVQKKGAVIAHPYAPLGGSMDDPVVLLVVEQLLALDFVVCTFNFRGAATSKGSTSWSGKGERDDYMTVTGHLIFYLSQLSLSHEDSPLTEEHLPSESNTETSPNDITLILAGYSYGSLIVTRLPSTEDIIALFHSNEPTVSITEIFLRATTLAERTNAVLAAQTDERGRLSETVNAKKHRKSNSQHSIIYGGSETSSPARNRSGSMDFVRKSAEMPVRLKQAIRRSSKRPILDNQALKGHGSQELQIIGKNLPHISMRYLLISPLLPPLSNMLSLQAASLQFWRPSPTPDHLVRNPTLIVFGTADIFTSAAKLEAWCGRMHELSLQNTGSQGQASFEWDVVKGASHFWRERGVEKVLGDTILEWVQKVVLR